MKNKRLEHLTHYKKINLSKDISLRYFYTFQDNRNYENQWVLKSHSEKKSSIITPIALELLLTLHKKDINKYTEIIGKIKNDKYQKIIIKPNGKIKRYFEKEGNKLVN